MSESLTKGLLTLRQVTYLLSFACILKDIKIHISKIYKYILNLLSLNLLAEATIM